MTNIITYEEIAEITQMAEDLNTIISESEMDEKIGELNRRLQLLEKRYGCTNLDCLEYNSVIWDSNFNAFVCTKCRHTREEFYKDTICCEPLVSSYCDGHQAIVEANVWHNVRKDPNTTLSKLLHLCPECYTKRMESKIA